jgi:hypothetical protein
MTPIPRGRSPPARPLRAPGVPIAATRYLTTRYQSEDLMSTTAFPDLLAEDVTQPSWEELAHEMLGEEPDDDVPYTISQCSCNDCECWRECG